MRIVAVGFLGLGNLGDETLADLFWRSLGAIGVETTLVTVGHLGREYQDGPAGSRGGASGRRRAGGFEVTFAGAAGKCRRFDLRCPPGLIGPLAARLGRASGVVFLGGYLGGFTAGALAQAVSVLGQLRAAGTEVVFWGSGFGPFGGPAAAVMRLLIAGVRARGTLRDPQSLALARVILGCPGLELSIDPVALLQSGGPTAGPRFSEAAASLHSGGRADRPGQTGRGFTPPGARLLRALLIPMALPGSGSIGVFEAAAASLRSKGYEVSTVVLRPCDLDLAARLGFPCAAVVRSFGELTGLAREADMVVSTRFHGLVAAFHAKVPCVSVAATFKNANPAFVWPEAVVSLCRSDLELAFSRAITAAAAKGPRLLSPEFLAPSRRAIDDGLYDLVSPGGRQ